MYSIDNPKKVRFFSMPEETNFTGVVQSKLGNIAYYINGNIHREDGPAIIYLEGAVEFYKDGKRHREDGPAVIYANGYKEYWINQVRLGEIHTNEELEEYLILRMFE